MGEIVNNMSVLPQGVTPNMEIYNNKFNANRATYAENKMLYEKARMQMAKDEIEVAEGYQPIVENVWNNTLGGINDAIEIGDFIGLEGVIDKAALDYATDTDLNMAKYNTGKYQEQLQLAREYEKSRGSLLGGYILESVKLPSMNKDGSIDKMGETDFGAEYFDTTSFMKGIFDTIKADVKTASNTDINDFQFVTVNSFDKIDGKLINVLDGAFDGEAKVDPTSGILYVKYNNSTRGGLPNGVTTISKINDAKAELAYELLQRDHNAIAYFNALARIGNKVNNTNDTAEDLMLLAANYKHWQSIYRAQAIINNDEESLTGFPQPKETKEVASAIDYDESFNPTWGSATLGGESSGNKYDAAARARIIRANKEFNDRIINLTPKLYKDKKTLKDLLKTPVNERTNATREKIRTLESEIASTEDAIEKVYARRAAHISEFREAIPLVREGLGWDATNEILTADEIGDAMVEGFNGNVNYYEHMGAYIEKDEGGEGFYRTPTLYKKLDDSITKDIQDAVYNAINYNGATTRNEILANVLYELGISAPSTTDHKLMISTIADYAFNRQYDLYAEQYKGNEDAIPLKKEDIANYVSGEGTNGISEFLDNLTLNRINFFRGDSKKTIEGRINSLIDKFSDTDYTIDYKFIVPEAKDAIQMAFSKGIKGLLTHGTLYDKYGNAIQKEDGTSHGENAYSMIYEMNNENLLGTITDEIRNGGIGVAIYNQETEQGETTGSKETVTNKSMVFLDNATSMEALNLIEKSLKEENINLEIPTEYTNPYNGLTKGQFRMLSEYRAMLKSSSDGILNSDRAKLLDNANNGFLMSSSSSGGASFNTLYTIESYERASEGESRRVPKTMIYNMAPYEIGNSGNVAYFDYIKRGGKIGMQVTYPSKTFGGDDILLSKYVYTLNTEMEDFKSIDDIHIEDLDKRNVDYFPVSTPRGILIVTDEPILNIKDIGDFISGKDAITATDDLIRAFSVKK